MITGRPERLKTFDYLGLHQYFLTFCTYERRALFLESDAVVAVRSQIQRAANDQRFAVIAYCYMPDHVHMLVEGQADDSDCRQFVSRAKQYSGFHYKAAFDQRLWQRYGYERTLRSDEASISVARYILENPIRARLVKRIDEYPFSGSSVYSIEQLLEAIQLDARWYARSG
jgi:putative transposase